jgi:FHS family L-fucose permease-like MFS transporter
MTDQKSYAKAFIAVTSLFFIWGFLTVMVDALVPRLKAVFELSNLEAGLVQFAWFTAYFVVSIPAGLILRKIGYKKGIIVGLCTMAVGCLIFFPAADTRVFFYFLTALFILAGGMAMLQVAANPFVAALGPEKTASSRLNLSQAFNSLGATIAPILSAAYLLGDKILGSDAIGDLAEAEQNAYYASEASAVQGPFMILAGVLLLMAAAFFLVKLPAIQSAANNVQWSKVFSFPNLTMGALGIFVYVGAEVALGSYYVLYFVDMGLADMVKASPTLSSTVDFIARTFKGTSIGELDAKGIMGMFLFFYWGGAMLGRFIGSFLTRLIKPSVVLSVFATGAILMLAISMMTGGLTAMWAALLVGLFNSIMFPTIFTMSIHKLGDYKAFGSGILCTAIVGGAVIPPLYGLLADTSGASAGGAAAAYQTAFILPVLCYAYICFYGVWFKRWEAKSEISPA